MVSSSSIRRRWHPPPTGASSPRCGDRPDIDYVLALDGGCEARAPRHPHPRNFARTLREAKRIYRRSRRELPLIPLFVRTKAKQDGPFSPSRTPAFAVVCPRPGNVGNRGEVSNEGFRASDAAARLAEIEAAVEAVERSLARWRRGLAGFVAESLEPRSVGADNGSWLGASRSIRVRAPETGRLVVVTVAYDAACAETVALTASAREAGVFNPHREAIVERARLIRSVGWCGLLRRAIPAARARCACESVCAMRRLTAQPRRR